MHTIQVKRHSNTPSTTQSETRECGEYMHQQDGMRDEMLLNQARAGLWPARAWFLKITSVRMYVCVSAPEAMNN